MAIDSKTKSAFDKKFWAWAWNYFEQAISQWKSTDDIKKALSNWTFKNYTNYTELTGNRVSSNTAWWKSSDLSYMKPVNYYGSWNKWDKSLNLATNPDRETEIKYNVGQDQLTNTKLFQNRNDFNKYYNYAWSSASQQQLLDELWENANKYWLNSAENYYADNASKVAEDANIGKLQRAASTYSTLMPKVEAIKNKLDERLSPLFDQLQDYQAKYLSEMWELKKLQNDYYTWMRKEYDALAAWQAASVGSWLSWQWLSQSAIASTIDWVNKAWQSRYNDLQEQHIKTLSWLMDSESSFMNNYWTLIWNLTSTEQTYLDKYLTSFKTLKENLDKAYNEADEAKYAPYLASVNAKVTWMNDSATKDATKRTLEADYQWADEATKINYIRSYLKTYFWDDAQVNKYVKYLRAAAQSWNDLNSAFEYLAQVTGNRQIANIPSTIVPEVTPEWDPNGTTNFNTITDYSFLDLI